MSDYVRPQSYSFIMSFQDGNEILIDPSLDTIHIFPQIGNAAILKFWNTEERCITSIAITEEVAGQLAVRGVALAPRDYITEREFDVVTTLRAMNLREEDFGLDGEDIELP